MPTGWESSATTRRPPNGTGWRPSGATARRCSPSPCCTSAGRTERSIAKQGAKLLAAAAKLGHAAAAYDLGLLYLEGQMFPQDFAPRGRAFPQARAQAGIPEAQYALATLYKEGRGVPKNLTEAVRLLAAASAADNTDAQVEYAIALFNGTGVAKERGGWRRHCWRKRRARAIPSRRTVSPIFWRSAAACRPIRWQAIKWHIIAKAGGVSDIPLDTFVQKQPPEIRAAGEKAAKPWLDALKEARESALLT